MYIGLKEHINYMHSTLRSTGEVTRREALTIRARPEVSRKDSLDLEGGGRPQVSREALAIRAGPKGLRVVPHSKPVQVARAARAEVEVARAARAEVEELHVVL